MDCWEDVECWIYCRIVLCFVGVLWCFWGGVRMMVGVGVGRMWEWCCIVDIYVVIVYLYDILVGVNFCLGV